jgi:hypothetical protein
MATGFARYRIVVLLIIAALCAPANAGASKIRENKPFLVSSTNKSNPFVGEEILLTYRLYFRDDAPKISDEVAPSFQGLWARETRPERFIKSITATVQGEQFRSAVVKQFRLVPVQSGKITISGYSMLCTQPNISPDGTEFSDSRFRITAPAITISARALPEPVPEKLSGAVGVFSLNLLTDKQNLRIGEPLALKLVLTGTGSLLTLELPTPLLPESFRHNPPERTTILNKESETSSGTITSTMIVWPQSAGDFQIPAIPLVVFNPEAQQFTTLHSKPVSISVAPADQDAPAGKGEPLVDTSRRVDNYTVFPFFTVITILVLMTSAGLLLVRKKHLHDANKPVEEYTTKHPVEGRKYAKAMKQQLFAMLETAGIQRPEGMTRIELNGALLEFKIPDEIRLELPEVLDLLDKILYSPTGEKESRIPGSIEEKVNTLLHALKKAGS